MTKDPHTHSHKETFAACVNPPRGILGYARKLLRGSFLAASSIIQAPPTGPFLRCLAAHYVFDDQRHDFELLVARLRGVGDFISTADLIDMISERVPVDGRYFHLSFDDGLGCIARNALPILAEHSIPATLFVNSAVISATSADARMEWEIATNYRQSLSVMTWDELRVAAAAGIEIGSHTRNHRRLSSISVDSKLLENEVAGCKRDIEEEIGQPCNAIAWPYGSFCDVDNLSHAAIKASGYQAAFSLVRAPIEPGQTSRFAIPRHHFEPQWPWREMRFFAHGGMEQTVDAPKL